MNQFATIGTDALVCPPERPCLSRDFIYTTTDEGVRPYFVSCYENIWFTLLGEKNITLNYEKYIH